ncbi:MAG: hypothetical protein ACK4VI_00590 [Alphaproteobacteria bacterium]
MQRIINLLRNLFYKLGLTGKSEAEPERMPSQIPERTQPRVGRIDQEAVFAMKDGYLVLAVDHQFDGVPSWIEWDGSRNIVSFTQMGGDMDEMGATIKAEYVQKLIELKKVLLVSNDNGQKIVHFVSFIARQ